jgi:hypothetical protein
MDEASWLQPLSIIFIDEFEALVPSRSELGEHQHVGPPDLEARKEMLWGHGAAGLPDDPTGYRQLSGRDALTSTTVGSVLFALVFLRWSSIPAAVGVHAGWNWTRDLILTPASAASILRPVGTQEWTSVQWNIAQAIFIGVSLLACVWLLRSSRRAMRHSSQSKAEIGIPLHSV